MSAWTLIPLLLGLLGVGGGVAFLLAGGGGLLAAYGLSRLIPSPAGLYRFFTHPVGVLLTMAALSGGFWVGGDLRGKRVARAECAARIQESRDNAAAADTRITKEAQDRAERQRAEADVRVSTIKTEVQGYVEELAKRTGQACKSGDDVGRFNDGLDVRDDEGIPATHPQPPARPGRSAVPGALPKGKGQ